MEVLPIYLGRDLDETATGDSWLAFARELGLG